jgi:hypothetical protein
MAPDVPASEVRLSTVGQALAARDEHRVALAAERACLDARDAAIADAVRAGALLEEIADAASITRAAASLAARRTLAPRLGRGGPYSRRRGAALALAAVSEANQHLLDARRRSAEAKARRDTAIAAAIDRGVGVRVTARALGMNAGAVSTIAREGRSSASTDEASGAVASER